LRECLFRQPDDVCHPEDDGLAVVAGADQLPYAVCRIGLRQRGVVAGERCLVGDDARDGQAGRGGAQRDRGAG
jgi:hypothetical protein